MTRHICKSKNCKSKFSPTLCIGELIKVGTARLPRAHSDTGRDGEVGDFEQIAASREKNAR
jgi:hypothetical protein